MTTTPDIAERLKSALSSAGRTSSDYDLNPSLILPEGRVLKDAAVLVPVLCEETTSVILTKRASGLKHHPGQIAFPGGKVDATDASACHAALREAEEEIGLPAHKVAILGSLPSHETVTGFTVTPFLGLVEEPVPLLPEPGETEEIFTIPLTHLLDLDRYIIQSRIWRGQVRRYYTVPYGPYYVWGATARILRGLAERMST